MMKKNEYNPPTKHWLRLTLAAGAFSAFALAANAQNFGPELFNEQFGDLQDSDGDAFALHPWASLNNSQGDPSPPSLEIVESGSGGTTRSNVGLFQSVGNREHRVTIQIREPNGPINSRFFNLQNAATNNQTGGFFGSGGTGFFDDKAVEFASPDSGLIDLIPRVGAAFADSGRTVRYDDLVIFRETAAPVISSNDAGTLTVGQSATFSLFNSGGTDGSGNNVFFDPDMNVTSGDATISSSSWVDDTEFQVTLTPNSESFSLDVENPYGGLTDTETFSAVPEPSASTLAFGLAGLGAALLRRRKS